jgi:hypothetical protein
MSRVAMGVLSLRTAVMEADSLPATLSDVGTALKLVLGVEGHEEAAC